MATESVIFAGEETRPDQFDLCGTPQTMVGWYQNFDEGGRFKPKCGLGSNAEFGGRARIIPFALTVRDCVTDTYTFISVLRSYTYDTIE